ncbi:hypothetical protein ACH5RR_033032 [Cinchona calisaya]|uniref:Uncharacterized protein n=1 Tax=Cinchona calisaya TaxID=153742 RepID=A0ABD2YJT7_9GENT
MAHVACNVSIAESTIWKKPVAGPTKLNICGDRTTIRGLLRNSRGDWMARFIYKMSPPSNMKLAQIKAVKLGLEMAQKLCSPLSKKAKLPLILQLLGRFFGKVSKLGGTTTNDVMIGGEVSRELQGKTSTDTNIDFDVVGLEDEASNKVDNDKAHLGVKMIHLTKDDQQCVWVKKLFISYGRCRLPSMEVNVKNDQIRIIASKLLSTFKIGLKIIHEDVNFYAMKTNTASKVKVGIATTDASMDEWLQEQVMGIKVMTKNACMDEWLHVALQYHEESKFLPTKLGSM